MSYDHKRFAILYVDDEEKSRKYFVRAFGMTFRVYTATNAAEGYRLLEDHQDEIGVVLTDQRMPGEQGVQLLEKARRLRPQIIRILVTAYSDIEAAVAAVNSGAIYKYITKPWEVPLLETTLQRGLEFFAVQMERDLLLREKLSAVHRLLITDRVLSLGVLAAGLGHRFRNSMGAIRAFIEAAPESRQGEAMDLDELRGAAFWQQSHRAVRGWVKLLQGFLDDHSSETRPPFHLDAEARVQATIDEAIGVSAAELAQRRIQVTNAVPSTLPALRVDARRFKRLFLLVLRNELLHLPEGSWIRFEAAAIPARADAPAEVTVSVTDNGGGIPVESLLAIFDPVRLRESPPHEAGVCLLACYVLVFHHGGRIRLGPDGRGGLALTISLPLDPALTASHDDGENFLIRVMTNERLWQRLLAGA